jgi:ATP-dependent Clp protease ATP-binding subunit ClpA
MFSPEFRNRLDARVAFDPLSESVMGSIVAKFVTELAAQLAARDVTIALDDAAKAWLAKRGFDPDHGARPLARVIQDEIKKPLGEELLFGALEHGGHVEVGVLDDKLHFRSTPKVAATPTALAVPSPRQPPPAKSPAGGKKPVLN